MKINDKKLQSVIALPAPKRYDHFIKVVADQEKIWGLYKDGWALAETDDDNSSVFPMWPAKEYAVLCAVGDWAGYEPESFTVDELLNELLPKLRRDQILPGIFYTPSNQGVVPEFDQLIEDLRHELSRYE